MFGFSNSTYYDARKPQYVKSYDNGYPKVYKIGDEIDILIKYRNFGAIN